MDASTERKGAYMELGDRLAQLRTEQEWKQTQIAKLINVDPSMISKYEQGIHVPDIDALIKLAECYDVSLDYLLGRSEVRSSFRKFQTDIQSAGGVIPLDRIFELNEMDKELLRLLLVSLSAKPEYASPKKSKNKNRPEG